MECGCLAGFKGTRQRFMQKRKQSIEDTERRERMRNCTLNSYSEMISSSLSTSWTILKFHYIF